MASWEVALLRKKTCKPKYICSSLAFLEQSLRRTRANATIWIVLLRFERMLRTGCIASESACVASTISQSFQIRNPGRDLLLSRPAEVLSAVQARTQDRVLQSTTQVGCMFSRLPLPAYAQTSKTNQKIYEVIKPQAQLVRAWVQTAQGCS